MKIFVLTRNGVALGIAQRLAQEGHEVEVYSDTLNLKVTGETIYAISTSIWKSVQECKFIVTDSGNWSGLSKRAKTYNKPIIGCNKVTDLVNEDALREYEVGKRVGVKFPKSEIYNDATGLYPKILEGTKRHYYVKYGRKVFPCTKPEWLAWAMYQLPPEQQVLLQEEVLGHDLTVTGWFNGLNWVKPFFYSTPKADRVGGVTMLAIKRPSKYINYSLLPLGRWLKVVDYKGPVTANLICTKADVFVRNFYIGLTAPSVFAMIEGLKDMPLGDFLHSLAFGTTKEATVTSDYIVGIEVFSREEDMRGAPILGIEEGNLNHIFLHGVFRENGSYMLSNELDRIYTASAHGRDMKEATQRVYRTVEQVQFPKMIYMTNLEGQTSLTLDRLRSWGVI